jgi:hypothetical protein
MTQNLKFCFGGIPVCAMWRCGYWNVVWRSSRLPGSRNSTPCFAFSSSVALDYRSYAVLLTASKSFASSSFSSSPAAVDAVSRKWVVRSCPVVSCCHSDVFGFVVLTANPPVGYLISWLTDGCSTFRRNIGMGLSEFTVSRCIW